MTSVVIKDRTYLVDDLGCLIDPSQWDEDFAQGTAREVEIPHALTQDHWKIIRFLRQATEQTGRVTKVYQASKNNNLRLRDLMRLFPTGHGRGTVVLAGLSEGLFDKAREGREPDTAQ